jgi:molecular chaperone DnaK
MAAEPLPTGIDLGTTNSAVAQLHGVTTTIVKNNEGDDTTPSAVYVDRRSRLLVGRAARERQESDPENARSEFKGRMGVDAEPDFFPASGTSLSPEQLSAEVLKSLLNDVETRTGSRPGAAAITVPAAFDLSASEATRRAAELAGLDFSPMLSEPAAAALACGFQLTDSSARWLVYDLGGGTFDAAIVDVRDGEFRIVQHRGDNVLGGKLVDWRIVEELLLPALARELRLPPDDGPHRGDARWRVAVAKLKRAAEVAKIQVSRAPTAAIYVDVATPDGERVDVEYELTRADVERFTEPLVVRSVNLCRAALAEARLRGDDIDRVVLVGGPTQTPLLRELLADRGTGLGITLDHSQDPLTVVARGAAIFAAGQRRPGPAPLPTAERWALQLEYAPMGPDAEPLLSGKVIGHQGASPAGLRIQVSDPQARPPWRSGAIAVGPDGVFHLELRAEPGRLNSYRIDLSDATGRSQLVTPDMFGYTIAAVETDPPLAHSVGVGLDDNRVEWLLERGQPLPARRHVTLRTTVALSRGRAHGVLRVPVIEGEHPKADRNRTIGQLEVTPGDIARDVPPGSEIDLTIEIDASRAVTTRAYIPLLDREFEHVMDLRGDALPDRATLQRQAQAELDRLTAVHARQRETPSAAAAATLEQLSQEGTAAEIDRLVRAAGDPDAAATARKKILDIRAALDDAEDSLTWPVTVREAQDLITELDEMVTEHGNDEDRRMLTSLADRIKTAVDRHDLLALTRAISDAQALGAQVLDRAGYLQFMVFEQFGQRLHEASDPGLARVLHDQGKRAVASGDMDQLRAVNRQMWDLFDEDEGPTDAFSTVRRS